MTCSFWTALLGIVTCGTACVAEQPGRGTLSSPEVYYGMCDASAAVAIGTNFFAVANDEDNVLRIYRRSPGGLPYSSLDLSRFLEVKGKSPETDIEAAATIGNRVYWITSHGRNAKGKEREDRHRFFATDIIAKGDVVQLKPVGAPYHQLLNDFAADERLRPYRLQAASMVAPKEPGGLNIEGMVARPDGTLLLGFRNPIPHGRALLLPLLNPSELIAGVPAKFGDAIEVDLGGLGVRSIGYENGRYAIIAGPAGSKGESKLFTWPGPGSPAEWVKSIDFTGLNPEGLAFETVGGTHEYFILSDDGTRKYGGIDCKKLPDPRQRRFRGFTVPY